MDMSRKLITLFTAALVFSGASFASSSQEDYDAIAERIKPVGDVYLAGAEPEQEVASGPRDGATIYGTFCVACHGTGVSGAPKINDAADWTARIAQGKETMADHAINGFNAMPARGACMDCSDDEIIAAIDHMIADL
ncbi:cytochrome C [Vibrio breoganii]|uniref:Cytochrome C n=1 Tax=Vibrio breoganii TaxID=553239 RepID=A0AAJ3VNF1_9VIBR|nr:cytochrome c5 family protein [Vibrio breoganii]ANO33994.1 cytochrome C [Vibrio breoganii]NMO75016.1 cytochrome c5 family protein [Vibrio breoganii]NMR71560.1 cytochrome c5 family protein [Vibrio breoganii]OED84883.1 cytochrome C [Vibrio breoganii ZF-55]OED95960.1 cytochrome C [Vibrio breoganii ZF-29]